MTPYWLLFALWAVGTIQFTRAGDRPVSRAFFIAMAFLTALMIGLRYEVGGDWYPYINMFNLAYFLGFGDALEITDPAYAALNWIFVRADVGIWPVNLICGILFVAGVGRFASRQINPWLAMTVAIPYFVIVVAMGFTRQAAAIGIICFAMADADERSTWRIILLVALAAMFHKTAILMLPVLLLPIVTRSPLIGIGGVIAFALLFTFILGSASDRLVTNYAQGNYNSQGAAIRVSMNVLAAAIFLLLRKRWGLSPYQQKLWTYASLLAVVSLLGLLSLSASAGVDRLALFLIPLQLLVFSRLPYALSANGKPQVGVLFALLGYGFAVQFVWLNYADNAAAWVPYSSVLSPAG